MSSYYSRYDDRYKKMYSLGIDRWGHSSSDVLLTATLEKWVNDNSLAGKKIIDFACGEGACGVILSRLGCLYHGVDLSPAALERAREGIKEFKDAKVSLLNMVEETTGEIYDAAVDSMGLHMLVTDSDREKYLKNAFDSLKSGGTMLFFREMYGEDSYSGAVASFEDWKRIKNEDFASPKLHCEINGKSVSYPILPARGKNRSDYYREMETAGFKVVKFVDLPIDNPCSACITVKKP